MAYDRTFGEWVYEHFAALGPLEIKPMFGAAAVYSGGLIFALLDDGVVWLKADGENEPALREAGARQFTYSSRDGRTMAMTYWSLPDSASDDTDEAVRWARTSIAAAVRKAATKKPRKPKT
ncbi:TfoX/Sxy family protein [uncultured Brevundimonas sp.]|uniref:TfoX/Sxy family protein n=1 Tax=uncultured Brevundimonas sp. TaxID=213418 RepID=UPI0030EE0A98|tara:strand:+ start:418 stop:780 length:363 start_codon:yes stop_codon:yes gene_type:complete